VRPKGRGEPSSAIEFCETGSEKGAPCRMTQVTLSKGDRIEQVIKKFRRKVERAGILADLKAKRRFEKPCIARRRKSAAARRRVQRRLRTKAAKTANRKQTVKWD